MGLDSPIALENALRKFPQRIVVLLDDLDRLYPAEAYEMVRIIKAVGDLPNVGYVLAWDEKYVSAALDKLNVPLAATYLDKVVQIPSNYSAPGVDSSAGLGFRNSMTAMWVTQNATPIHRSCCRQLSGCGDWRSGKKMYSCQSPKSKVVCSSKHVAWL